MRPPGFDWEERRSRRGRDQRAEPGAAGGLLRHSSHDGPGASAIDWPYRGIGVKEGAMEDWLGYSVAVCIVLLFMMLVGVLPVGQ